MKSDQEMDDELIAKYLSGDASSEEAIAMMDWLQLPANRIRFEQFEKTWNASARQTRPAFSSEKAWTRIEGSVATVKPSIQTAWWASTAFKMAASLFLVAATALVLVVNFWRGEKNSVATQRDIKSVMLPDSSQITLFRFSAIEYAQGFNDKLREVEFSKGEAFFQVAHNTEKPFIIHTPTASIKVVGTEFNVKIENNQTQIAVKEGKVLVYSSTDSILLTAGLNAIFKPNAKAAVTDNPVDNNVWSYATRRLTFKDTPLASVIGDLQRAYPCTISIANAGISHCKLTATFENDSVDKIINLIAETLSLEVKRNGDAFVLVGEGCP